MSLDLSSNEVLDGLYRIGFVLEKLGYITLIWGGKIKKCGIKLRVIFVSKCQFKVVNGIDISIKQ
jgi:hypothetical protein